MKRTVEICTRIRHHLDLSDVKFRSRRVTTLRLFTAQVIRNHGRWKTFVSDHSMLDAVGNIHQLKLSYCSRFWTRTWKLDAMPPGRIISRALVLRDSFAATVSSSSNIDPISSSNPAFKRNLSCDAK